MHSHEKSIIIVKQDHKDIYSKKSIYWLEYVAKKKEIFTQHAINLSEKNINGKKVDLFFDMVLKIVIKIQKLITLIKN